MHVEDTAEAAAMAAEDLEEPETWQLLRWYCHCGCGEKGVCSDWQPPAEPDPRSRIQREERQRYIQELVRLNPDGAMVSRLDYKYCPKCDRLQPAGQFIRQRRKSTGHGDEWMAGGWCQACAKAKKKEEPPLSRRELRIKKLRIVYGITPDQYDALVAAQGGRCAICQQHPRPMRRRSTGERINDGFAVDHDHSTGRIRGVLCVRCNTGIGQLGDDPVRLDAAAAYIRSHSEP